MKNFIRIIKYGRPYLGWLILGFGLIMILAQSQLFMPLVQRFVIDQILTNAREELVSVRILNFEIERTPVAWLGIILGTIIGFYTLVGLLSYARTYVMTWVSQKILFDLRKEAFTDLIPGKRGRQFPPVSGHRHLNRYPDRRHDADYHGDSYVQMELETDLIVTVHLAFSSW